jgi:CheY-like chemotaxis protein
MEVRALVATTDNITASMLRRCLNSVGVSPEEGVHHEDVMARVRRFRFEAVIVDLTISGGGDLLKRLRADASTRNSVLFALADDKSSVREAFQFGSTFVLEKPLSLDRTLRCFRAAYGLIIGERRRYHRHRIGVPVTVLRSGAEPVSGYSVDVSSGGLLLETTTRIPEDTQVKVQFTLPRITEKIVIVSEVIWSQEGRVGLRFVRYSRNAKELLTDWLGQQVDREMGFGGNPVIDMKMPATL